MQLTYNNILLRSAVATDAKQLAAWWNDGAVMAHAGFPKGLGITEEKVARGLGKGSLIIEERGIPIGEANYRLIGENTAEIGIKICVAECQNHGIGRIVLSMLIRYLFENGFSKIILDTNLTNTRAQHVYESLGFQKLRVNVDAWTNQLGALQSSVDYELTQDHFIDFCETTPERTPKC